MKAYEELEQRFGRSGRLRAVEALVFWDTEVMMPPAVSSVRAEELAALRAVIHELEVDPAVEALIARAEQESLEPWQAANLQEIKRRYQHQRAVPGSLVEKLARACTECSMTWRQARRENDFPRIRPPLQRVVELVREQAQHKAEALGLSPYDALLDEYEPGARAETIAPLFDRLLEVLPQLTAEVIERQDTPLPLDGPFPLEKQRAVGLQVMQAIGFDFDSGRLDVSTHPFCDGAAGDVRITTRYSEANFTESLMATIHETGHALYEQGLPARWHFQPVGHARSMGMHESQSLLVEMQACRSREFLRWLAPILRRTFGGSATAWSTDNLYRHYRRVERGLIRVDADELTYPAHVILRFRLERALVAGELSVADLPSAWNEGMQQLVGITPPDDRDGCLQDIHWMDGTLGYFPTYTLGAMTAAQLYEAALRDVPAIPKTIGLGDFGPLSGWLRDKIHARASSVSSEQLLVDATGKPLDPEIYLANLRRRYLD